MISPRATLTSTAPRFIAANRWRLKRFVVSGVHWQQTATKSAAARKRSSSSGPPISAKPGGDEIRCRASGADNAHSERRAQPSDLAPDAAGPDDAGGLPLDQDRPVGAVVEAAGLAVVRRLVEPHRHVQHAGDGIFRYRQRVRHAAQRRHDNIAAPYIAGEQVAGAGLALVQPFQLRRPRLQVERKRPAADDDLRRGQQPVALRARPVTRRPRRQIARHGIIGPGVADFAVEPAASVDHAHARIDRRDLGDVAGGDALTSARMSIVGMGAPGRRVSTASIRCSRHRAPRRSTAGCRRRPPSARPETARPWRATRRTKP